MVTLYFTHIAKNSTKMGAGELKSTTTTTKQQNKNPITFRVTMNRILWKKFLEIKKSVTEHHKKHGMMLCSRDWMRVDVCVRGSEGTECPQPHLYLIFRDKVSSC